MKLENKLLLLPENFESKMKYFYGRKWREKIEEYAQEIESEYNIKFRIINWNEKKGLVNISTSPSTGLDLITNRFVPHNIYDLESKEAEPLVKLALYYISILESL